MTAEPLVTPPRDHLPTIGFEHLRRLALAAVGHPGGRPWCLAPIDGGVQLLTDGPAVDRMSDAGARALRLAAGAAVTNMRLGIAMGGHRPVVTVLPSSGRTTVLARLYHGPQAGPTPVERALASMIMPVNRFLPPVADLPAPPGLLLRSRAAVEAEGLWLRTLDPRRRAQLAHVDARIAALPDGARLMELGSNHDVPAEHVRAGSALQRLLLTVRLLGGAITLVAWPADLSGRLRAACTTGSGDTALTAHVLVALSACGATPWSPGARG
ncbi:hypothetical protein ACQEVB_38930 [Pseudonocardia sp. CA-107938]|uniref:hypothetical protein n=1 Tax=Pseudonocardia sp. CA-107938 TaxID=3240021 RepID=UPI003D8AB9B1